MLAQKAASAVKGGTISLLVHPGPSQMTTCLQPARGMLMQHDYPGVQENLLSPPTLFELPRMDHNERTTSTSSFGDLGGPPPPKDARQGRHKQRYAPTGERLVAGCIPVRVNGTGLHDVDVLLISSRAGKGYCFPKGGWEDDETLMEAAKRETVEEAGVRGVLEESQVGTFPFSSGKPGAHHQSVHQGKCIAHMYVLHVAEMLDVWPESEERQRIWVPLVEAVWRCRHEWMREALLTWVRRKGWTMPTEDLSARGLTPQAEQLAALQQGQQGQLSSCASSAPPLTAQQPDAGGAFAPSLRSVQVGVARVHAVTSLAGAQSPTDTARQSITFASANSISTDISDASECVETARSR